MTHSLSFLAADSSPEMNPRATLVIEQSSTSMNVGTVTAAAMSQGLKDGRNDAGDGSRLVIIGIPQFEVPEAGGRRPWSRLPAHRPLGVSRKYTYGVTESPANSVSRSGS